MNELIDRQALKDAVKRYADEPIKKKDRKCQAICLDMLGTIDAQPTIDAVPVRHGKWIVHTEVKNIYGGICVECPVCGDHFVVLNVSDEKYCRSCGAKMDEERREG